MSITVQEVITTLQNYENKDVHVLVWDDSCIYEIDCIDDTMDDRVELNLVEFEPPEIPEPTFNEHHTYNMMFAIAAFQEGLEVWVTSIHPKEWGVGLARQYSLAEIVDCDGRLFVIKKGEDDQPTSKE